VRILAFLICLFSACLVSKAGLLVDDNGIKVYEYIPVLPTGTPPHTIVVNGKTYHDLVSTFYVRIPEKGFVGFVTKSLMAGRHLNLVPLTGTDPVIRIKLAKDVDGFGASFTGKYTPGSVYVEAIKDDKVYFAEKIPAGVVGHYCLDLLNRTFVLVPAEAVPLKSAP
jgi:hypothetical protein